MTWPLEVAETTTPRGAVAEEGGPPLAAMYDVKCRQRLSNLDPPREGRYG
jgi:hypothetical protein